MIDVRGDRVIVEADAVEEVSAGGIVLKYDDKRREQAAVTIGVVVGIGPNCWEGYKGDNWCEIGDKIVYAPFSGGYITDPETEKRYVIINDRDVLAVIKKSDET